MVHQHIKWTRTTSFKFSLFTLTAILSIVVLTSVLLWLERDALLHEREVGARQAVETAYGVLDYYHDQSKQGVLSEQDAKIRAMDAIRGMRYSGEEYFWINDMQPTMLMHPFKPDLEGKDLSDNKDPNGLRLFVAFVDTVKASPTHDGFVFYMWPKQGKAQPVDKVSYVKGFEPWGWILGSGVYLDTVNATVLDQAVWFGIAALILAVLLLAIGRGLSRNLVRHLGAEPDEAIWIADRMAQGDLGVPIEVGARDTTSLLYAMKVMRDGIARTVAQVRYGTDVIGETSSRIVAGNLDLSARTEQQAASLQETAASMEELTSTVGHNASNAQQANALASSASDVAKKGGEVVSQVVRTMDEINQSAQKMADIVSVIDGIAFQTNILALNAAVEAARAGEQGKGFAVVASEVRSLAQRSSSAAREIKILIDDSVDKIHGGAQQANSAGQTMSEIVDSVQRVTDIMAEITLAGREQASGIEQINLAVGQMDQVTQQNAGLVVEAGAAAHALREQMEGLTQAVSVFRLSVDQGDVTPTGQRALLK